MRGGFYYLVSACVAIVVVFCGCAQNQEQPVRTSQSTRGSATPQEVTINVYTAGGNQSAHGAVTTTQPAHIALARAERVAAASRPAMAASAADGTAESGGAVSGGNINITPIWVDSSSLTRAETGAQSPHSGAVSPRQQGTQRPETQVNPAVSLAAGNLPTANASSTSGGMEGTNPATSGTQTQDSSGARTLTSLRNASPAQLAALQAFLQALGLSTGDTVAPAGSTAPQIGTPAGSTVPQAPIEAPLPTPEALAPTSSTAPE